MEQDIFEDGATYVRLLLVHDHTKAATNIPIPYFTTATQY